MKKLKYLLGRFFMGLSIFVISLILIFATGEIIEAEKAKETQVSSQTKSTLELADYYRSKGDNDKAITVLQEAIKNKERPWPELTVLSECYIAKKDYKLAEEALRKAMKFESNPKFASHIYRTYGTLYLEQKKFKQALKYLKKAIRFADTPFKKADAYYHLARLDYAQKKVDSAIKNVKEALKLIPDNNYFNDFLKELESTPKVP